MENWNEIMEKVEMWESTSNYQIDFTIGDVVVVDVNGEDKIVESGITRSKLEKTLAALKRLEESLLHEFKVVIHSKGVLTILDLAEGEVKLEGKDGLFTINFKTILTGEQLVVELQDAGVWSSVSYFTT